MPQTGIVGTDRLAEELENADTRKIIAPYVPKTYILTEELPDHNWQGDEMELRAYYADT